MASGYRIRKGVEADVPVIFKFIKVSLSDYRGDYYIKHVITRYNSPFGLGAFSDSKESSRISADRRERSVKLNVW